MWDWLLNSDFMPHGYCLAWDPRLVALHAGSDLLILAAYTAIPIAILIFLRKRPNLQLRGLALFFAAFIFWCGLTHLMGLVTLWYPLYDLQGVVKGVTALVSVAAAVVTFRLIPKALAIPSPRDLQRVNDQLRSEIAAHQRTLEALQATKAGLEARVQERTSELERVAAHATLLMREIVHRSGNLMSVVTGMARQSLRHSRSGADFVKVLTARIEAMGRSYDLLVHDNADRVDLKQLVGVQLQPFMDDKAFVISGPTVALSREAAQTLGMIFHELASASLDAEPAPGPEPRITVTWWIAATEKDNTQQLEAQWIERRDGAFQSPPLDGWSTFVLEDLASDSLQATTRLFIVGSGLEWRMKVPITHGLVGQVSSLSPSLPLATLGGSSDIKLGLP